MSQGFGASDDEFEDFLAGGDPERGGLFHWRLFDSYEMIRELLDDNFTLRNESIAEIKEPATTVQPDDQMYRLAFREAACSSVAVGAIAPLVDTLLNTAARKWKKKVVVAERDDERDVEKPRKGGLVAWFKKTLAGLGIEDSILPDDVWQRLDALFCYRNNALHKGYEWPPEDARAFAKAIQQNGWAGSFEVGSIDGEPWLISMTDSFIRSLLADVGAIANALRAVDHRLSVTR